MPCLTPVPIVLSFIWYICLWMIACIVLPQPTYTAAPNLSDPIVYP